MSGITGISQKLFRTLSVTDLEQKAKLLIPAGIVGIWGVQTAMEVSHAVEEDKKNTFINNVIIGAAMILGGIIGHRGFQRYLNKKIDSEVAKTFAEKHLLKNIPEKIGNIIRKFPARDFLQALSIPFSAGILGGVAGEFAQRKFPVKYDEPDEVSKKANKFIDYKYGIMNQIDDIPGADYMDNIHPSFSTIVGYSVGKQKGIKNKIKEFVFEIISGVLVPTAIILPIAAHLNKKFPEPKYKGLIGLITFGAAITASFAGKAIASWFNLKVTDKIIEDKFWQDITAKQKQLMKSYMFTDNPFEKQQIQEQVQELKEFGDKVKSSIVNVRGIASKATSKTDEKTN